ncbi:MAG: hypothetical protein GX824_01055 [Clostridiales bacterium]|nr:hypothetical protein [Clostridiales bacterium]
MRVVTNKRIRPRTQSRIRSIRMKPLTMTEIIRLEPRIKAILEAAKHDTRKNRALAYSVYKHQLQGLVGWGAEQKGLRTNEAYEATVTMLCDALKI